MNHPATIVCGIDPGLKCTGYAVLRLDEEEGTTSVLDAGVLRCTRDDPLPRRLAEIAAGLDEVLDEYRVEIVAVEQVYSHYQRPRTALLMAHARGVVLMEAARRDLRVIDLPATTIKKHLTGNGRASKQQIQRAVAAALDLEAVPEPPDVADALAVALCAARVLTVGARKLQPGAHGA